MDRSTPLHGSISRGVDLRTRERVGNTPLHNAADKGNLDILKELVKCGADLRARDNDGYTPLHRAADKGNLDIVKELVKCGADLRARDNDGYTPLHRAADKGNLDIVKELVKCGADLLARDNDGYTPLHRAADKGNLDIVKELVKCGADLRARDNDGYTPLHRAADRGNLDIVKELIKSGADLRARDNDGYTPLHRAADRGNLDIVKELVKSGADLGARNDSGRTPLMWAVLIRKKTTAEFLSKEMTVEDLNIVDNDGWNVLHLMAVYDRPWPQMIQYIAERSPDLLKQSDGSGDRPIDSARSDDVYNILEEMQHRQQEQEQGKKQQKQQQQRRQRHHHHHQQQQQQQQQQLQQEQGQQHQQRHQRRHHQLEQQPEQEQEQEQQQQHQQRQKRHHHHHQQQQQEQKQQRQHHLYTSGIADNVEKPCNITITVVGHHGVGKSCFVRQLKHEHIPEGGPGSTDTADFFVNHLGFDPDTWFRQRMDEDGELKTCRQRLKRIVDRQRINAAAGTYASTSSLQHHKKTSSKTTLLCQTSKASPEDIPLFSEIQRVDIPHHTELTQEQRNIIEEVMSTAKQNRHAGEVKGYVTIYDFGGEKVFYNTHHCFMSSNMVFVLVFDVAMCLDPSRAKDGYERIEFWLRNIATYAIDRAAHCKGTPPVILVGSHLDLVSENKEEQKRMFDSVLEKLYEKPEFREIMETHVQEKFHIANLNDSSKNLNVYDRVWNSIIAIASLQSQWMKPVPARWVALEYELVRLKNEGRVILIYAELLEINRRSAVPLAEDNVMEFFMKLRLSGSFLCFDLHGKSPFIVLQPQWIINAFKAIITDPKFKSCLSTRERLTWTAYENSGVISHNFIRQLWKHHAEQGFLEEEERLFIIMETLGLLTKPLSVDAVVDYFIVPSILQPVDHEIILSVLDDPDIVTTVTLCVKFDNPFIPQAVWDKMIASCIHRFQRLKELGHDGLDFIRRGFACLSVDSLWHMIINCCDNAMKVTLFKTDTDHSVPIGVGINLLTILEFLLQRILEMNHQSHLRYQFYLHNDYRFSSGEHMVKVDDLRQTSRLRCYSLKGPEWIDSKNIYTWFKDPDEKEKQARPRHVGKKQELPDRKLSYKEIGRVSKYIGSTYQTFFAELDCPLEIVEQEMEEHRHLAFRSRITKIFIHLQKTKADTGFQAVANAMFRHGMDPSKLLHILDSNRDMFFIDETLSERWLKMELSVNDALVISDQMEVKSYFNLFLELGFSPTTVDEFDDHYRNKRTREKITALLTAFIKETKPRPAVNALLLAMKECDMDTEPVIRALKPS